MKQRSVENERFPQSNPDRAAVLFHFSERIRIKNSLYNKAGMGAPPQIRSNNLHPVIRSYIRRTQLQIWLWQISIHYYFWTDRIERAWQEIFADESFRRGLEKRWKDFLQIPAPKPGTTIRKD